MIDYNIKPFLGDDFLLENKTSRELYHDYASKLPIIDYHNHLPPAQIAENKVFTNLTEIWLKGDHYKWRAMRTFGINEEYITGKANDREKFIKWAETVPHTMRNPLYHWTHLELKRYFYVSDLLNAGSAEEIYDHCNSLLVSPEYSTRNLLIGKNVKIICTTDDPIDNLEHHISLESNSHQLKVLPAFRPDKALLIRKEGYADYIKKLGEVVNSEISSYAELISALENRIDFFDKIGCRISDHGLSQIFGADFSEKNVNAIFQKALIGDQLSDRDEREFQSALLYQLGELYSSKNWIMQLHVGALRNTNTRMLSTIGPDTGYDSIGDYSQAEGLARFLNQLDNNDKLPKTIIYNLNPRDNEVMATMVGNFSGGGIAGKIQWGSAWWFLDQKDGMEKQLNTLSNMSLLSTFIGMLTDSRSFLSFPRHEYFRRILCNLIGKDVHKGELPNDVKFLGEMVSNICYQNAKNYFNF